jgi:hypothetical protein
LGTLFFIRIKEAPPPTPTKKALIEKFRCKNERPVSILWLELWAVFFNQSFPFLFTLGFDFRGAPLTGIDYF